MKVITSVMDDLKKFGISNDPKDFDLDLPLNEQDINTKLPFYNSAMLGLVMIP